MTNDSKQPARKLRPRTNGGDGALINTCEVPQACDVHEIELYRKFHSMHCARREKGEHDCMGRVTLDRNGVTLQCPRCGDSRKVYANGI